VYLAGDDAGPLAWQLVRALDGDGVRVVGASPEADERVLGTCAGLVAVTPAGEAAIRDVRRAAALGLAVAVLEEPGVDAGVDGSRLASPEDAVAWSRARLPQQTEAIPPYAFLIGRLERDFAHAREAIRTAVEREAGIACLWSDDGRHRTDVDSVRESTRLLIRHASFVIADLTLGPESPERENPSRAHEIGLAIGYGRELMLSSREPRRYPYFSIADMQLTFWADEGELAARVAEWIHTRPGLLRRRVLNYELPERCPGHEPRIARPAFRFDPRRRYAFGDPLATAAATPCAFCLGNEELRGEQILVRGTDLYLCAPRGQLVEGCLIIAPYRCISCLARAPRTYFAELMALKRTVEDFYRVAYGATRPTFYEQGRAGGGALVDSVGGFPHHAHLCCVPRPLDLREALAPDHEELHLSGLDDAALSRVRVPYVYVEEGDGTAVYVARSDAGREALERVRLKPEIAWRMGLPGRGDWRSHPGDSELGRVIAEFTAYRRQEGSGHG
jgi:hypothetical protein